MLGVDLNGVPVSFIVFFNYGFEVGRSKVTDELLFLQNTWQIFG
jgi:hypothetical protein